MPIQPTLTAPVRDGHVEVLGLTYTGPGLARLVKDLGPELQQVEVWIGNPRDLRAIRVRHRPSGYMENLRCTDQIYAAMTNVDHQTVLVRRERMKALALEMRRRPCRDLGGPRPSPSANSKSTTR